MDMHELYDKNFMDLVEEAAVLPIDAETTTVAMKNLEIFSKCRPPAPSKEIDPEVVPTTKWEKFKHGTAKIWDNETTRVFIKAGGAFAGVAVVVYSTVHKDHVIERQALAQATQSR